MSPRPDAKPLAEALLLTAEQLHSMPLREIDTAAALLSEKLAEYEGAKERSFNSLHRSLGDKFVSHGRVRSWKTTDLEAETAARDWVAQGRSDQLTRNELSSALARIDAARERIATLEIPLQLISTEFDLRGGWSRFFLVTNVNGHIHNTPNCSTMHRGLSRTQYAWLPDLSGKTEAEAVREHGPLLCTVCFPSAPVEWTVGKPKPAACPGTGRYVKPDNPRRGYHQMVICPECGERVSRTPNGNVRKHPPKDASPEEKSQAPAKKKAAKPVTISDAMAVVLVRSLGNPSEDGYRVQDERSSTLAALQDRGLVEYRRFESYRGTGHYLTSQGVERARAEAGRTKRVRNCTRGLTSPYAENIARALLVESDYESSTSAEQGRRLSYEEAVQAMVVVMRSAARYEVHKSGSVQIWVEFGDVVTLEPWKERTPAPELPAESSPATPKPQQKPEGPPVSQRFRTIYVEWRAGDILCSAPYSTRASAKKRARTMLDDDAVTDVRMVETGEPTEGDVITIKEMWHQNEIRERVNRILAEHAQGSEAPLLVSLAPLLSRLRLMLGWSLELVGEWASKALDHGYGFDRITVDFKGRMISDYNERFADFPKVFVDADGRPSTTPPERQPGKSVDYLMTADWADQVEAYLREDV